MSKIKVGLVYGGKSGEHDVSLLTAQAVMKAFDYDKYEIIPFYITKQGEWRSGPQIMAPVEKKELLAFAGTVVQDQGSGKENQSNAVSPLFNSESRIDVIFPLLHGTFGEDGTIQGLLEMANIPYVGAGVLASAVGMDKVMMKKVFAMEGLQQCDFRYFNRTQWQKDRPFFIMEIETSIKYPCFVKPANLGSSVGISKASNREDLIEAINHAFLYDRKVIVEENVEAREIEVSVLGNDEPVASVPGEIVSSSPFYDYQAKYIDGKSTMVIPAEISKETAAQLQALAVRAFMAIDGSGLSRVDFFVRKSDGEILINEINTMPGFTPFSMYPLLWQHSGKPYKELLDDLISLAMYRHKEKQTIHYGFDVE
ncbi:MAG TPA: D-alanine--D-alanine ligase [Bacilli bacterium]